MMWRCATPILTGVLALAWDATREALGAQSGAVVTDKCSLWSSEREYWSKTSGTRCR